LSALSADHPLRHRAERHGGRMPSQKTILGSLLLGLLALFLYVSLDYAFQLPLTLFIFACLAACLAAFTRGLSRRPEEGKMWMVTALLPLLLSGWAASFGLPQFYASHLLFKANEELDRLLADPDLIFSDPGSLSVVEGSFKLATEIQESNGAAWEGLGNAYLAQLYASFLSGEEIASMALPAYEKALQFEARSWMAHYNTARSLALLGRELGQIEPHLKEAMRLAPRRPEPVALMGGLLLLNNATAEAGLLNLRKALELEPGYEPAQSALERIVASPMAEGARRPGFITGAYFAEQFRIQTRQVERVRGAGLPKPVDTGLQPDSADSGS